MNTRTLSFSIAVYVCMRAYWYDYVMFRVRVRVTTLYYCQMFGRFVFLRALGFTGRH